MNEYLKQAKDFLESTGSTVKFKLVGLEKNNLWGDNQSRNHYKATIQRGKRSMTVDFWDSVYHTNQGKKPSEYDLLACLQKWDDGTFENFCSEYGYDTDSIRAERIYKACLKEYEDLQRLFTDEEMELLQEIQ